MRKVGKLSIGIQFVFYMGKLFQTRASEILRGWGLVRYNHSATSISPPNNLYIRGDLKNKILDPD